MDSFLNHQLDPNLMYKLAEEFARLFADKKINKIVTIEASGIAPAIMLGYQMQLPVVFIKGMARDLFADMGLTIAFSLLASLLVAMTVVPSASAALFKKSKPRKQRIFSKIQKYF